VAKILIVDDEPNTGQLLTEHLTRHGHVCNVQRTGERVIETLQKDRHDLLILDVMLPHTSGFEVCRRVRRDPELYMLPILIVSAMNNEEEILHGLSQGADDFVPKPFDVSGLMLRIDSLLRSNASSAGVDEMTSLPGSDASKRELQRRISVGETFSVAHCELLHLREFARKYGAEARAKAVRHLARALSQCAQELTKERGFVGHMGGGHFLIIMPSKHMRAYCPWVRKVWNAHVGKLYQSVAGMPVPPDVASGKEKGVDIIFCVTPCEKGVITAPPQVFEVLSHLRTVALNSREGGIFMERRGPPAQ
jgi:DNA-binding response OmpR family regulator